ncbi:MAG: hypothetical protein KJZ84_01520 [Bryobacteraceae bacterium]|nr:hypothetical protein [Bryobacteraceae bacterium]
MCPLAQISAAFTTLALAAGQPPPAYDPLRLPPGVLSRPLDFTVRDSARSRDIPVRVFLPAAPAAAPVVLFSHGLGGSNQGNDHLSGHWSGRGYAVVFVQHTGSDNSVWKDKPLRRRRAGMEQAASAQNLLLRLADIPAVLNQLSAWNKESRHPLAHRLDLSRIGMSGHSFGALTTQGVSGQSYGRQGPRFTDRRIRAAVMFSPSTPRQGEPAAAFGSVQIPWMLMTGTSDTAAIGGATIEDRLNVYPHLPPGGKYELVLDGAEHSAFTDRRLPGDKLPRNPNHHRAIQALTTAFWDAHLRGDTAARAWLESGSVRGVLEAKDRWQHK